MSLRPAAHILLALIVITGVIGLWAGDAFPPVWRALAAFSVLGLVYEWISSRSTRISVELLRDTPLHLGRAETAQILFTNGSRREVLLEFQHGFPDVLGAANELTRVRIPAGGTSLHATDVLTTAVGTFAWTLAHARIAGPLGLAWWHRRIPANASVAIVPDTLRRRGTRLGTVEAEGQRSTETGSGFELHHLREYRPGDPRQSIDWKASARTGSWVTRVRAQELQLRIVVVLDAGRTARLAMGGLNQLGHYINLTARLLEYAALHDDHVGLVVACDKVLHTVAPGSGLGTVNRIRKVLAELATSESETDLFAAALAVRRLSAQRCLVILLTDPVQGTTGSALSSAVQALVPKHLPVVIGMVAPEVHQLEERSATTWLDPWHAAAAGNWRSHLDGSLESLRKQGAIALTATPDELEVRVFDAYRSLRARRRAG